MERMFQEANRLVCRWDGETLIVEPWGENGLRVRSAMLREPEDTDYALLPQERAEAVIMVGEEKRGKIPALCFLFTTVRGNCFWQRRERAARSTGGAVFSSRSSAGITSWL